MAKSLGIEVCYPIITITEAQYTENDDTHHPLPVCALVHSR